jgi:hypothetical protein
MPFSSTAARSSLSSLAGDGVLELISLADPSHIAVVQHVQTQAGSRTGTIDSATGRIYMLASKPDRNAAPRTDCRFL